jgi:hypothetical protein
MAEPHSIDTLSDEQFGWYLAGLTDGEGSFTLYRPMHRDRSEVGSHWVAEFRIAMRDDEERNIRAAAVRLKCGRVYNVSRTGRDNPQVWWRVTRVQEAAEVLVPFFDRFPLQFKKSRDFAVWREAVLLLWDIRQRKRTRLPGSPQGFSRKITNAEVDVITSLSQRLKSVRQYAGSRSTPRGTE